MSKTPQKSPAQTQFPAPVKTVPPFKNLDFLESDDGRLIRLICEFQEPESRFRLHGIRQTIVFFGSARIRPKTVAKKRLTEAEKEAAGFPADDVPEAVKARIEAARRAVRVSRYYHDAEALAHKLTRWSLNIDDPHQQFVICSGGGPGIMEAANKGAHDAGGRSIGLNVNLPFEQEPNPYITPGLAMEFRYFTMRKLWFNNLARCVVVFPGGWGTFDEFFELATLLQTQRNRHKIPLVLFGSDYWKRVIDFDLMADFGVINPLDEKLLRFCDDVDEAYDYIVPELEANFL